MTLPTAAVAVTGASGVKVDDGINFSVIDRSSGSETITMALGTGGGTIFGNVVVSAAGSGLYRLIFTNVTAESEAYDVYRL